MRVSRTTVAGVVTAGLLSSAALGAELQRPSMPTAAHPQRNAAARALINNPRIAGLLSESAQLALQPLLNSSSDLMTSPLMRAPRNGAAQTSGPSSWVATPHPLAFNNDHSGMPQNETTVSTCGGGNTVVGGWNDFRNQATFGDITGWGISTTSGASLTNSNFLPGATVQTSSSGTGSGSGSGPTSGGGTEYVPSQGDPIVRTLPNCFVYASSLLLQPDFAQPYVSGVLVDASTASTLASCTTEPACWPTRRAVAFSTDPSVFYDKPFMAIDPTPFNAAVWIGFTRFSFDQATFTQVAQVEVVRCDINVRHCTAPTVLATGQSNPFGFTTTVPTWATIAIGSDGSTHVSWATIQSSASSTQQTIQVSVASAPHGTTKFTAPVTVTQIGSPVLNPFASQSFRINGMPDIGVSHVGGVDRLHVVYAQCRAAALGICEHSEVILASSRTGAAGTWTYAPVAPGAASDFFPTLTADQATGNLLVGFWTTRFDIGQHSFDVVAVPVNAATGAQAAAIRVTTSSIEPDNDSLLGAFFIGDYSELAAVNGKAWAHFTSTQRLQQLIGQGVPIPQQDNVLSIFSF